MANNQIMVSMKFQADTSQAKAKMQELQNSLKALQSLESSSLPLGKTVTGLEQAKNAAAQLQVQLQSAFNQDTGKLDLSRFNQSLRESNMSLQQYKNILLQAGPAGQQAFGQLAVQIASADTHVIRISSHVAKLGRTLANTFRWQISSAALMSVTSTISEAYSFAQDLNESLNNIRIVTGNSANEMARFAKEANNAAKALSTTTTKYTDASLIYFQQGLNEKQVKERTDLTIKMANVTGQSVAEVSDQLTAVWNNFDDGTETLEHYVDVMTALGAATASSSKEISEGLNKFAAVAETVGLSYEYAASALATVTSTTRQSADIVGTAFKTLFARIQDLELGETLDDGTTMGQYSQALAAVGINIKDVNGEVKNMDIILDEMGVKWNTLSKDAQIALAQNVAGVRQYTQLIALMDNWSFFQENLELANESTGALQEQADIYAESWEAARDKVTAALEDIYQDLLKDDVFIGILEFFAGLLENIDNVIESVGGLNGVLTILAAVLMKVYQNSIATSLSSMGTAMMSWTKAGQARINQTKEEAFNEATTMHKGPNASDKLANENIRNQINTETRYNELTANASEQQKAILNIRKEQIQKQNEENEKSIEELRVLEQITAELEKQADKKKLNQSKSYYTAKDGSQVQTNTDWASLKTMSQQSGAQSVFNEQLQLESYDDRIGSFLSGNYSEESLNRASDATEEITNKMQSLGFGAEGAEQQLKELFGEEVYQALEKYYQKVVETSQKISELKNNAQLRDKATQEAADIEDARHKIKGYNNKGGRLTKAMKNGTKDPKLAKEAKEYAELTAKVDAYDKKQKELIDTSDEVSKQITQHSQNLKNQTEATINAQGATDAATKRTREFVEENKNLGTKTVEATVAVKGAKDGVKSLDTTMANALGPVTLSQKLTTFASMAMSASMALQGFKSLVDTWNNEDISFGDKLIQTMMSLSMIIPAVTTVMNKQNLARLFGVTAIKLESGETIFNTTQKGANTVATWLQKIAQDALNGSILATIAMFAIFAVAVAAIIGIIYLFTKAQEKEKTALEKATEAAKRQEEALKAVSEAAKEMKENLQEAKDLIASYSEVSNAFDGLVEGSSAYNENLQKQSELISELLEKYPELMDMGIVSLENGRYQVDEAALEQYVVGTATVNMLNAQIAKKYAQIDSEKANALVETEKAKEEFNNKIESQTSYSAKAENGNVIITDGTGNTWTIDNKDVDAGYRGQAAASRAQNVSTVFNTWKDRLDKGETLDDIRSAYSEEGQQDSYFTDLFNVFEEYLNVQTDYAAQLEEIDKEHLEKIAEINKKYEAQYKVLAQEVLSYQKGFSNLNQFQQSAAIAETAQKLEQEKTNFNIGYGENFDTGLADYILEASGISKSSEYKFGEGDLNDIGDFFVNTKEGTMAAAAYLRDVKGYTDMSRSMLNDGTYTFDTKGMKSGDGSKYDIELDWAEVAQYYAAQMAYERTDYEKIMARAANRSDATNAVIGGTIGSLSENDIAKIARGDRDSGYTLNKNSAYVAQAASELGLVTGSSEYEQWLAGLQEQLNKYDAALAETMLMQQDFQKGNQLISESAEKYGLDADVVENYAKSLYNANKAQGMSYETASKLAIANTRLSKGIDTLRKNWSDTARILNTTSKDSYEWMEAATEVSKALEDMFGVAVSTDFIDQYSGKIATLVEGGDEAVKVFQELELLAGQDFIATLNIDDEYKTQFQDMLADLTEQEDFGLTVGIKGEISDEYKKSINELLRTGALTADQVTSMFNSIGWEPNITTEEGEPVTNSQEVRTIDMETGKVKSWERIETVTKPQVPVIGDITSAPKQSSSIKTNTTSGSSGSSKKTKKDKNTEVERYHEINEELDDLQRKYDAIGKAKDRAFGQKKLDLIRQEAAATQDLIDAQAQLIGEIEGNLKTDKDKLKEYGANFDPETGRLTNYDEMYDANINQYNWAVDEYNAGRMTDEQFEEYEKEYEEFVNDIAQYEETLNKLEEEQQNAIDLNNQLFDNKLEDINYSVDLDIELAEDKLALLEYQIERLGDSLTDTATKFEKFIEKSNINAGKMETYQRGIEDLLGASGLSLEDIQGAQSEEELTSILDNANLTQDQIDKLKEYSSELLNLNSEMLEMRDTIQDDLVNAFQKMNEEAQKGVDKIDDLSSMIQEYRDIIDLVGKDNLGISTDLLNKMNQASLDNSRNALKSTKEILDMNKESLKKAEEELKIARANANEEDIKFWEETIEAISKEVTAGEQEMLSRLKNSLQEAANVYQDTVNQIMDTFEKSMSGLAGSFDELQTKYDQQSEVRDRYLQDYEKIYNLSKLTRDIEKSIDDTDSVRAKSKLRDIQEEIYALQESGAEMTQFEVDELRAKYELRLAEIALEEAQNAKSQVRMQRDSNGNWGYVYTADQDQVDSAQQNMEDKLYAYQQLTQERIDEMQEQMIGLPQEYSDAIAAIAQDMTLTDEERKTKMEETTKYYEDKYKYLGEQLGIATDKAAWLYENDWNEYSKSTGYKISSNQQWTDSFNETLIAQTTGYTSLEQIQSAFSASTSQVLADVATAFSTYQTNVSGIMTDAGTSVETFASDVEGEMNDISTESGEAATDVANLADEGEKGFKGLVDAAADWLDDYNQKIAPYITKNEDLATSISNVVTAYSKIPEALTPVDDALKNTEKQAKATAAAVATVSNGGAGGNDDKDGNADQYSYVDDNIDDDTSKNTVIPVVFRSHANSEIITFNGVKYGKLENGKYAKYEDILNPENQLGVTGNSQGSNISLNAARFELYDWTDLQSGGGGGGRPGGHFGPVHVRFDTGGYTGEWGSEGRIAMLHQKELVLNPDDTTNFLSAINIVRDIASLIDLRATAQQSALSMMSATSIAPTTQTLQQEVTIHAEFPNATQRTEIEAAFDTLLNRASQFANRKNK